MDNVLIHEPKNYLKIDKLFAFISVDDEGNEGIVAIPGPTGIVVMPAIGADMKRIDSLRPMIKKVAKMTNRKIKLIHFSNRTEVEEIL